MKKVRKWNDDTRTANFFDPKLRKQEIFKVYATRKNYDINKRVNFQLKELENEPSRVHNKTIRTFERQPTRNPLKSLKIRADRVQHYQLETKSWVNSRESNDKQGHLPTTKSDKNLFSMGDEKSSREDMSSNQIISANKNTFDSEKIFPLSDTFKQTSATKTDQSFPTSFANTPPSNSPQQLRFDRQYLASSPPRATIYNRHSPSVSPRPREHLTNNYQVNSSTSPIRDLISDNSIHGKSGYRETRSQKFRDSADVYQSPFNSSHNRVTRSTSPIDPIEIEALLYPDQFSRLQSSESNRYQPRDEYQTTTTTNDFNKYNNKHRDSPAKHHHDTRLDLNQTDFIAIPGYNTTSTQHQLNSKISDNSYKETKKSTMEGSVLSELARVLEALHTLKGTGTSTSSRTSRRHGRSSTSKFMSPENSSQRVAQVVNGEELQLYQKLANIRSEIPIPRTMYPHSTQKHISQEYPSYIKNINPTIARDNEKTVSPINPGDSSVPVAYDHVEIEVNTHTTSIANDKELTPDTYTDNQIELLRPSSTYDPKITATSDISSKTITEVAVVTTQGNVVEGEGIPTTPTPPLSLVRSSPRLKDNSNVISVAPILQPVDYFSKLPAEPVVDTGIKTIVENLNPLLVDISRQPRSRSAIMDLVLTKLQNLEKVENEALKLLQNLSSNVRKNSINEKSSEQFILSKDVTAEKHDNNTTIASTAANKFSTNETSSSNYYLLSNVTAVPPTSLFTQHNNNNNNNYIAASTQPSHSQCQVPPVFQQSKEATFDEYLSNLQRPPPVLNTCEAIPYFSPGNFEKRNDHHPLSQELPISDITLQNMETTQTRKLDRTTKLKLLQPDYDTMINVAAYQKNLMIARRMREAAFQSRGLTLSETVNSLSDVFVEDIIDEMTNELELMLDDVSHSIIEKV